MGIFLYDCFIPYYYGGLYIFVAVLVQKLLPRIPEKVPETHLLLDPVHNSKLSSNFIQEGTS